MIKQPVVCTCYNYIGVALKQKFKKDLQNLIPLNVIECKTNYKDYYHVILFLYRDRMVKLLTGDIFKNWCPYKTS